MVLFSQRNVSLRPHTTLRAGGPAEMFAIAQTVDDLAEWASYAQSDGLKTTYLGSGSNVLPSDAGVPGLTVINRSAQIEVIGQGSIVADAGCLFQDLFLKSAQASLTGLEFAVGIPGTLGGALVSNAGAYRSSISDHLIAIEVVAGGERKWVEPDYMKFSYRDSILRSENPPPLCLLRVKLELQKGKWKEIYDRARDFQRQRISKQPPPASAGSFFKNVEDRTLAEKLPNLRDDLREAGVIPAGYLIEAVGLKGYRLGGAVIGSRHANFILNVGGATATEIRSLARFAQQKVREEYGVEIEEEVLYIGDWSQWEDA